MDDGDPDHLQRFADLASALACTRRSSAAAEAIIELRVAGLYVCVHQADGWPERICGPARRTSS